MDDISYLLSSDGPFAKLIPGFLPRSQQQELAMAVAEALEKQQVFIAEAGTGTGKTFAYLVPALLTEQKIIISTGTKNLQDQLFLKDLPLVRDAVAVPVDLALLKGRANYLCLHRMELALSDGRFPTRSQVADLQKIREWSGITRSGDIAELSDLAEDSPLWPQVTSTGDNCLGNDCDYYDDCHLMKARRRAQEADIVVVNHHLLFADMALRDEGVGELLPGVNALILDEAHQLPDIAANFFGLTVSGYQLQDLARDTIAEDVREAGETGRLRSSAEHLEKTVKDLRLAFGTEARRGAWHEALQLSGFQQALDDVAAALHELQEQLKPLAARGKGLESCLRRCEETATRYAQISGITPVDQIHWFETHARSFSLNLTPMDVASLFQEQIKARPCAWVFTSATLAVAENFDHFTRRLGLHDAQTKRWDSPFDFAQQAVLYVPTDMPEPNSLATLLQSLSRPCRCWRPVVVEPLFSSPVIVHCRRRQRYWMVSWITHCWCKDKCHARACWNSFVSWVMRSCWVQVLSGRVWMCAVRPYPVSSSISCRLPRPAIRSCRRVSRRCANRAVIHLWTISCRRR